MDFWEKHYKKYLERHKESNNTKTPMDLNSFKISLTILIIGFVLMIIGVLL